MALRNYTIPTKTIPLPGGESFTVTGISFNSLADLFTRAKDEMLEAMELYDGMANSGEITNEALGLALIQQLPHLAAKVIATAANEPDAETQAAALPLPTQVEALVSIAELTFTEPDALKKFVGHVQKMIAATKTLAPAA